MKVNKSLLYLYETNRSKEVIAKAVYPTLHDVSTKDHEFIVLKGSFLLKKPKFDQLRDVKKRKEIEQHHASEGDYYFTLTEDVTFNNPSHAASVILGKDVDGDELWFDEDDNSLKARHEKHLD